jgi:hypothetical protein
MYAVNWHPGQENLADYQSKHHIGSHHVAVRPWYLHMENPPRVLPWAARPSTLKGCLGTIKDRYIRKVPLPLAPRIQHASHTSHAKWPRDLYVMWGEFNVGLDGGKAAREFTSSEMGANRVYVLSTQKFVGMQWPACCRWGTPPIWRVKGGMRCKIISYDDYRFNNCGQASEDL